MVKGEIDFAAQSLAGEWSYFQVTTSLREPEVREQEFGAFAGITPEGNKYVLSTDEENFSQDDITHLNIINWLLQPEPAIC